MTDRSLKLLTLPGDGIGPEVMTQALRVLSWFAENRGLPFTLYEGDIGAGVYANHGTLMTDETLDHVFDADAILFGSIGGPEYDDIPSKVRRARGLLYLRRELDLFANLRPVKSLRALVDASTLKPEVVSGVDLVVLRELTGGLYFGEPRGVERLPDGSRRGVNTHVYTTAEIQRVAHAAFELAQTRRKSVCSVEKSNVMESGRLWREEVEVVHQTWQDIELSHMLADNCAMQLVRNPAQFDVIVTDNLFGDLLSDCAAMITGSLGMLPSASLGPVGDNGRRPALYEPVHGSAPDIAGRGLANPLGQILSTAMMLRYSFEREDDARLLEQAVEAALDAGYRTADIMQPGTTQLSTREMGDQVIAALDRA